MIYIYIQIYKYILCSKIKAIPAVTRFIYYINNIKKMAETIMACIIQVML